MSPTVWGGFLAVILLLLGLDLFVLNRKAHVVTAREALFTTAIWVVISLCFNVAVYFLYEHHVWGLGVYSAASEAAARTSSAAHLPHSGREAAVMFFTGYLVEQMLSLDNMMVIAMILGYFRVPAKLQHRVLFWGIIGAVVLRGAAIFAGVELLNKWHWVMYVFGAFLIFTAFKLLITREEGEPNLERNLVVRAANKLFNVSPNYDNEKFLTRINGKLFLTPLMVALLVVDVVDLVFAVDSIPAIFGITVDPFLVFTSNCFAILGLRSIYFAVAALIRRFRFLKVSMVFVLGYIGIKMIADHWYKISPASSLITIAAILAAGVGASLVSGMKAKASGDRPIDDLTQAAEHTWKRARRTVILIVGLTIVFIAAPLIGALPGPGGIFVAIGGLALLAGEFVWARKLLNTMKEKAQKLTGNSPTSTPAPIWKVLAVLAGYAVFVGLLVWAEETWKHRFPKLEKNWFFLAIGPGIAVGYWVFMAIKRRIQFARSDRKGSLDAASTLPVDLDRATTTPAADGSKPDSNQQRQRAGSAQ